MMIQRHKNKLGEATRNGLSLLLTDLAPCSQYCPANSQYTNIDTSVKQQNWQKGLWVHSATQLTGEQLKLIQTSGEQRGMQAATRVTTPRHCHMPPRKQPCEQQLHGLEKQQDRKLSWTALAFKGKRETWWELLAPKSGNFRTSQNTQTCSY